MPESERNEQQRRIMRGTRRLRRDRHALPAVPQESRCFGQATWAQLTFRMRWSEVKVAMPARTRFLTPLTVPLWLLMVDSC